MLHLAFLMLISTSTSPITCGENVMAEADKKASVVKKQTDDGWSIVIYNVGGVTVQDKFFASEADADGYLQEQQVLIDEGQG